MAKTKKAALREYTLEDYVRHVDSYGPEEVLVTASSDANLSEKDLGALKAFIESRERVAVWKKGAWAPRNVRIRVCEGCGLDLPPGASKRKRYHSDSCRMKAVRQRGAVNPNTQGTGATRTGVAA